MTAWPRSVDLRAVISVAIMCTALLPRWEWHRRAAAPWPSLNVSPGTGCGPTTRQCISISQIFDKACRVYPRSNVTPRPITPPAIAVNIAMYTASSGPSHAASAASSFTSPAPMPPSAKNGKKRATPSIHAKTAVRVAGRPPDRIATSIASDRGAEGQQIRDPPGAHIEAHGHDGNHQNRADANVFKRHNQCWRKKCHCPDTTSRRMRVPADPTGRGHRWSGRASLRKWLR